MNEHEAWFVTFRESQHYAFLKHKPIAYFCIEYALSDLFPTYAGGLGILAGDYVRELADQKIPSVAVGLLYQYPYDTSQEHHSSQLTASPNSLTLVTDNNHKPILVQVPIQDHTVFAKVWLWQNSTIPIYLLDTNTLENSPADKMITQQLYTIDKELRLKQEMILGIGGLRLLETLGIDPSIIHM